MIDPTTEEGVKWVARQQELLGAKIDGMLGGQTSSEYTYRYGPLTTGMHTQFPMPLYKYMWGYDHAYEPGQVSWPKKEPGFLYFLEELEEEGHSFQAGLLKLLTGFNPRNLEFNRWPRSVISLDTISAGVFHYWAMTLIEHVLEILPDPSLAYIVFSEDAEPILNRPKEYFRPVAGKNRMAFHFADFVVGWRILMSSGEMIRRHCNVWLDNYVGDALSIIDEKGWTPQLKSPDGSRILAAVTRMRNSGYVNKRLEVGEKVSKSSDPMKVLEAAYNTPRKQDGYGKPNRWKKIQNWPEFEGPFTEKNYLL